MRIKSECCPVKYFEAYLKKAELHVSYDKESPLIRGIFKAKSGHKISKTKGISHSRIGEIFKGYIIGDYDETQEFLFTVLDQLVH